MGNSDIRIRMSKAKDETLYQLDKEKIVVKKMLEESLGSKASLSLEEILELCFGRNGTIYKYFTHLNAGEHHDFSSLEGAHFLFMRSSSSASIPLFSKEANSLCSTELKKCCMTRGDCSKSWKTISSQVLPKIFTLRTDAKQFTSKIPFGMLYRKIIHYLIPNVF